MSVLQTVQKNNRQFTYGQTVQKNNKQFTYGQTVQKNNKQFTYGQTVQKNNKQFTYGQTVQKKLHWSIYSAPDSAKKNNNNLHMDRQCKKKTTAIYIWTDSAKNNSNLHMDSTYLQTVQKTMCKIHIHILSTHSVHYRDILNYQRHIIHRMYTSTLCTVYIMWSIHSNNVRCNRL